MTDWQRLNDESWINVETRTKIRIRKNEAARKKKKKNPTIIYSLSPHLISPDTRSFLNKAMFNGVTTFVEHKRD